MYVLLRNKKNYPKFIRNILSYPGLVGWCDGPG